jgi:adhesin transport system outer membrane protein
VPESILKMHFFTWRAAWYKSRLKGWTLSIFMMVWAQSVMAQATVSLKDLLEQANAYSPTLQAARLEKRASMDDLEAARRLYWPTVSAVAESTSNKSNALSTLPSRTVQVEQTLWDAGQVKSRISESKTQTEIQELRAALVQEDLYLQVTNAWQNLLASKDRMSVAQQTIQRLEGYQLQMQRRVKVEASPRIDLELANSRILQTQVEYTAAQNSLRQSLTRIEQYTGRSGLQSVVSSNGGILTLIPAPSFDATLLNMDWQNIVDRHPAIAKAKAEAVQSQNRLDQKRSEAWPQLYARISQPLSNLGPGYATGPTAFVGFRYTSSAGFSNQLQAQALATRVASTEELITAAATDLKQTLQVDQEEYFSAKSRIDALEKSVQGSDLVLTSYQRQFQGGKKTWQDLLNAVRELAQNQYALADARASMVGAMHRLQIRAGWEVQ